MVGVRDVLVGVVAVVVLTALAQPSRGSAAAVTGGAAVMAVPAQAPQDAAATVRGFLRQAVLANRELPAPLDRAGLVKMLDEALAEAGEPASTAAAGKVTGTVGYRERIMLPPSAVVKVQLLDVSRADAPATVLGEQTFETGGKAAPYAFEIAYDPAKIEANHTYAVQARIEVGGKLRSVSDQRYGVITRGAPTKVDILLRGVQGTQPK